MASRDQIIEKISTLSEERLREVADFLDSLEDKSKKRSKYKADLLSTA